MVVDVFSLLGFLQNSMSFRASS
jgi:hypothetical protein